MDQHQRVPRLTLKISKRDPLLLDFDPEMQQSVIVDGSLTAPVFALSGGHHQPRFPPRRLSLSNSSPGNALSRALSRTFTLTSLTSTSIAVDEWRRIFDKLDLESDGKSNGKIPLNRFKEILEDNPLWESVPANIQVLILSNVDRSGEKFVDFDSFLSLIRGNRSDGLTGWQRRAFREFVKQTVKYILPYNYQYQNQYSCSPPPLFMLTISLLQIAAFTYNSLILEESGLDQPSCSNLIFHPGKRSEIWRYLTYMFVHSGKFHLTFNILAQLALGILLEMVHGWWRVMLVYLAGILAGSLWTSVLIPGVFLSGASSGVYALITAHLATVIMNYREMTWPWFRIFFVTLIGISDVIIYFYRQSDIENLEPPVSYPAHISGAVIGLLAGITCLKNLRWENFERYLWAGSACLCLIILGAPIVFSLANPNYFTESVTYLNYHDLTECTSGPIII